MAAPLLLLLLLGGGAVAMAGAKPKAKKVKAKKDACTIADLPGPADLDGLSRGYLFAQREMKKETDAAIAKYPTRTDYREEIPPKVQIHLTNLAWKKLMKKAGKTCSPTDAFKKFRSTGFEDPAAVLYFCLLTGVVGVLSDAEKTYGPESLVGEYLTGSSSCDWEKAAKAMKSANPRAISDDATLADFDYGVVHSDLDLYTFNAVNRAAALFLEKGIAKPSKIKNRRLIPSSTFDGRRLLLDDKKDHEQWEYNLQMVFWSVVTHFVGIEVFGKSCKNESGLIGFTHNIQPGANTVGIETMFDGEAYLPFEKLLMWKDVRIGDYWWKESGKKYAQKYLNDGHDIEETALRLLSGRYQGEESLFYDSRLYLTYPSYERYFDKHPEAGYDSYLKAVDDFHAKYPLIYGAMSAIMNQMVLDFDMEIEEIDW